MIVTDVEHFAQQVAMNPKFERALDFLRREGWHGQADGTIPIDGDQVYGMLQSYETKIPKTTVPFEGHHKYIDVQYLIEGTETIFWTRTASLTPTIPYDPAKDIWFSQFTREGATPIVLTPGQLVVLFPEDAHAPTHCGGVPGPVRKIVIKVAV